MKAVIRYTGVLRLLVRQGEEVWESYAEDVTLGDVLGSLSGKYGPEFAQEARRGYVLILQREGEPPLQVDPTKGTGLVLGNSSVLTFAYLFTGG